MELIGGFNPKIPVNAFVTPIYEDDKGTLKTHIIQDGRISEYVKIDIENRDEDVLLLDNKERLLVVDRIPFFCYYKELNNNYEELNDDYRLIYGTKLGLEEELLGFLFDDNLNINAKIIISSFFDLVNATASFIDKGNEIFTRDKVNILLKKEYLIPTQKATEKTLRNAHIFFSRADSFLRRDNRFSWKSILLFLDDNFHFMEYYYSPEEFKHVVPRQHILAVMETIREIIERKMDKRPGNEFGKIERNLDDVYNHLFRREKKELKDTLPSGIADLAESVKFNKKKQVLA